MLKPSIVHTALLKLLLSIWLILSSQAFITSVAGGGSPNMGRDQLERLDPLIGQWSGTLTTPPSEWYPKSISDLALTAHRILGSNHIEMRLEFSVELEKREVLAIFSFNIDDQRFVLHWIDSSSTQSTTYRGNFESETVLLLTAQRSEGTRVVNEKLRLEVLGDGGIIIVSMSDFFGDFVEGGRFAATHKQ